MKTYTLKLTYQELDYMLDVLDDGESKKEWEQSALSKLIEKHKEAHIEKVKNIIIK